MDKNAIFSARKEMKKKSHQVVREHYVILALICLILSLFGAEPSNARFLFGDSFTSVSELLTPAGKDSSGEQSESDEKEETLNWLNVWHHIIDGDLAGGKKEADLLSEKIQEKEKPDGAFGHTNGVLASIVTEVNSGHLFTEIASAVDSIIHSEKTVGLLFILLTLLGYALLFIFLLNVFSAILRRIFLIARVYEKIPYAEVLHFAYIKKWFQACFTMLRTYVYLSLWMVTIVGGLIKYHSYWAVPYIVAENPSLKGKEAITLSRKMMDGHKMELFKYELSLIGWIILGVITFGISDLAYGTPYRMACAAEFYARVREQAIRNNIEGTELLDDPYLFRKASRIHLYEAYFDVVDEITVLHENRVVLTGVRKFLAEWFGIWYGNLKEKKQYDDQEGRIAAIEKLKLSMEGKAYPNWLNPRWRKKKIEKQGNFTYMRHYPIPTLFLLFIIFSFVGWSWEVALHYVQTGSFANRGTMLGPWLPIYGGGGVIVLMLCNRFRKNPAAEFIASVILCGILEYYSAWYLETKFHQRWWSYDGYFLNLHGRICAEGLLTFGIGCCAVVYIIAPFFDYLLAMVKSKVLIIVCAVLAVLFGVDLVHARTHPNMAEGAVETTDPASGVLESQ